MCEGNRIKLFSLTYKEVRNVIFVTVLDKLRIFPGIERRTEFVRWVNIIMSFYFSDKIQVT